jgi:hypothetical protein
MGLMGWTASAADFNLVAYTGNYLPAYPTGTIANLTYIPKDDKSGWQRITQDCNELTGYCDPHQIEIFLFVSTDFTDGGVGGIDLLDQNTTPYASGIYSGDPPGQGGTPPQVPDMYVTINNSARWAFPPPPGSWTPIHSETNANAWNGYNGYNAVSDTWYFNPFGRFALGAPQEDPSPAPGNDYAGNFYKGNGLQFDPNPPYSGWVSPMLGANGNLVPYMHLVINKEAMPCGALTWITVAGLPGLVSPQIPATYNWLGKALTPQAAPWAPSGRIEIFCVPEPASVVLLALAGIPAIIRRRK